MTHGGVIGVSWQTYARMTAELANIKIAVRRYYDL